jgi:hypothetical protein
MTAPTIIASQQNNQRAPTYSYLESEMLPEPRLEALRHSAKPPGEKFAVDPVAIADDVPRCAFPAAGFGELPGNPFGGRVCCRHSQPVEEMIEDPTQKIGCPRQLYIGPPRRDYVSDGGLLCLAMYLATALILILL